MPPKHGIVRVEYRNYHRYMIDGRWAVGVTTALKGVPKGALVGWAARTVAEHAVTNVDELSRMVASGGPGPAVQYLTAVPNQQRDDAAIRGTEVHALAERYIQGEEIEVPERLEPYVRGYAQFVADFDPTTVHEELLVASREHGYAGTLDSIQDIPGYGRCLVDYKTSRGVYGEHALQVTAYRHADTYVDADGIEHPMLATDRAFVLHIQPYGYALIPVQADEAALSKYLAAQANYVANVQGKKLDKLIGEPIGDTA